jgi:hypothetical protein
MQDKYKALAAKLGELMLQRKHLDNQMAEIEREIYFLDRYQMMQAEVAREAQEDPVDVGED